MKLAAMQPYPFPYIGYFELMAQVDRWVVLDDVQYVRRSWMNRNRILHPVEGWQYFCIPVKKSPRNATIQEIRLLDRFEAERRLLAQLQHYQKHAPYFQQVIDLVRDAFARLDKDNLVDLNLASLRATAERLEISFNPERCSHLGLVLGDVEHAGQWTLRIAIQLGADAYLNPSGGRTIYRPEEWEAADISLAFTDMNQLKYDCAPYVFEPHLSILDVLMWNDFPEIVNYLNKIRQRQENEPAV
ncbi:hypothetical protein AGMMS50256_19510 [Betaproteobacteria bacterium]|nr:hypothetical protein AGMMS50256_19510 [Betaproteobacteria bacterium]